MRMWELLSVLAVVASCLTGVRAEPGERSKVMGDLYWCSTLCMCRTGTQIQVQCFDRNQIYSLLGISQGQAYKMHKVKWYLEDHVHWCNDLCLCHSKNMLEFGCVQEDALEDFIGDTIDSSLLYRGQPTEEVVEYEEVVDVRQGDEEEEDDAAEVRRRSEERKKNRRHRKNKKRVRDEEEEDIQEDIMQTASPSHEEIAAPVTLPDLITTPYPVAIDPSPEVQELEAEILPKQEAVAASPAVTAMQPPSRRQPFPPTSPSLHASKASTRDADSPRPVISSVRELPVERKTVASEVSQDLDELGSAVMQIKSDVVLNQRILLVTVAVAGIAMLGVLILAVHSCARRRQMAAERKQSREQGKDDHHVTKINREEEW